MNEKKEMITRLENLCQVYKDNPIFNDEIQYLKTRLLQLESSIAVVGQFSVGKSALLNALLGEEILSSRKIESTKVLTRIRHCEDKASAKLVLIYKNGQEEIRAINQLNDLQTVTTFQGSDLTDELEFVDLYWPVRFLNNELILIDTPGANSLTTSAFEITKRQLKNSAAILYLFMATKGLDKSDYEILNEYSSRKKKIFLVGTHRDQISEDEWLEVKQEVADNIHTLTELKDVTILSVDVPKAISAKKNNDIAALKNSYLYDLEQNLMNYMQHDEYKAAELRSFEYALLTLEEEIAVYEEENIFNQAKVEKDRQLRRNQLIALTEREFNEVKLIGLTTLENRISDLQSIKKKYDGRIEEEEERVFVLVKNRYKDFQMKLKKLMINIPDEEYIRKFYTDYTNEIQLEYNHFNKKLGIIAQQFVQDITEKINQEDFLFIKNLEEIDTSISINWNDFSTIIRNLDLHNINYEFDFSIFEAFQENYDLLVQDEKVVANAINELENQLASNLNKIQIKITEIRSDEQKEVRQLGPKPSKEPILDKKGIWPFRRTECVGYDYSEQEEWKKKIASVHKKYMNKIRNEEEKLDKTSKEAKMRREEFEDRLREISVRQEDERGKLLESLYETVTNYSKVMHKVHKSYMDKVIEEWNNIYKEQEEKNEDHKETVIIKFEQFVEEARLVAISNIKVE